MVQCLTDSSVITVLHIHGGLDLCCVPHGLFVSLKKAEKSMVKMPRHTECYLHGYL